MNDNYSAPRRVTAFPCAVLQIVASLLLAISTKTGFLHIGVFLVALVSAMFALQSIVSRSYIYFVSAAVSVCGAFFIGGVFPAAMAAFAVPAGLITASMVKKKNEKIAVAATLQLLYTVIFAALFLAVYLLAGNEFSVAAIIQYFTDIVNVLKEAFIVNIEADEKVAAEFMRFLGVSSRAEFHAAMDAVFSTFQLILPAIIISVMGILGYLTSTLFKLGTALARCELVLPDPKWKTLPTKASAVIYSISYIIFSAVALFSAEMNVFLLACYSIVIVLTPLMLLMGIKWIGTLRNKGTVIVLLVFGTLFAGSLAFMILAFFGVREVFVRRDALKKQEKNEEGKN
jgi:hypothetical protein